MALSKITNLSITDDTIVNADIKTSAAIALSKLATDPSNATNLASGTVPTARLGSGTASSSTVLYGDQTYKAEPGGITVADQWRVTASFVGSDDPVVNWEQVDTTGQGTLGSAMSESSGIWTFPSTGIYHVTFTVTGSRNGATSIGTHLFVTINNSAYTRVSTAWNYTTDAGTYATRTFIVDSFIDVTDVANVKVYFEAESNNSFSFTGETTYNQCYANFIRLGDT